MGLLVKSVSQDSGMIARSVAGEKEKRSIGQLQQGAIGPWQEGVRGDTLARVGNHEKLLQLQHEIKREFELIKMLCGVKEVRPVGSDSDEDFGRSAGFL